MKKELPKDRIYHIGVMVGNIHTQHPKELVEGIYEAANGENVNITLFLGTQGNAFEFWRHNKEDINSFHYQFNGLYDYALISNLDVLIISYGTLCIYFEQSDKEDFFRKFRSVPLVILEEYDDTSDDSFIMSDNYNSMKNIMDHLIHHHHYTKIVHISGPKNNLDAYERRSCYIDCMEKAGIKVTDTMIEYGDYSTEVDGIVEKLLDNNDGVQAIVCANDEMAISAYRVCKKRGLEVGKDIAITGYDDIELAQRMDPPLTTCEQDGLYMGYTALKLALSVCREGVNKKIKIPAKFLKRASCGCGYSEKEKDETLESLLEKIKDRDDSRDIYEAACKASESSMRSATLSGIKEACRDYYEKMIRLLLMIRDSGYSAEDISHITDQSLKHIRTLFEHEDSENINISRFTEALHSIINHMESSSEDKKYVFLQYKVLEVTDTYIESYMMYESAARYNLILKKSWMAPAMIQKMIENANDEKYFYHLAMQHIKEQGAKSAFIFLLEIPQRYRMGEEFICPEKMYLAGEYIDDRIISYDVDERPVITKESGIYSRYPQTAGHRYVAYILFAEEYQYGLMLCETNIARFGILYGIGLQISTAQAYLQMSKKEAQAKKQLYETLRTLEEKNQILNFSSSYDSLTNLYNRRGFMEKTIDLVKDNRNKKAAIFFSDLDHLKQINDIYGHQDGDYAICSVAGILSEVFKGQAFSGRTGGDEFLSISLTDERGFENILLEIKEKIRKLNEESDKPYYIEFSTGYTEFECSPECSVKELIDQADKVLYEEKKKRRTSIVRE